MAVTFCMSVPQLWLRHANKMLAGVFQGTGPEIQCWHKNTKRATVTHNSQLHWPLLHASCCSKTPLPRLCGVNPLQSSLWRPCNNLSQLTQKSKSSLYTFHASLGVACSISRWPTFISIILSRTGFCKRDRIWTGLIAMLCEVNDASEQRWLTWTYDWSLAIWSSTSQCFNHSNIAILMIL